MFRVWNTIENRYEDGVFINGYDGTLVKVIEEKTSFKKYFNGGVKYEVLDKSKFIIQNGIGLNDKKDIEIHEGDIVLTHDGLVLVVVYVAEIASYAMLDYKNMKYYYIDSNGAEAMEIIGTINENRELPFIAVQ